MKNRPSARWMATAVAAVVVSATAGAAGVPASFAATGPAPVRQAPALFGAPPISASDRVYTADQTSNTVTVIDPRHRKVLGTLALGDQRLGPVLGPQYLRDVDVHGLGFSRDGRYLNVISVTSNTVTVVRTNDNAVISRTTVGRAAHEGFFSPDGRTVWVADRALKRLDIVDALHGGIVGSVATADGPSKVLFSPNGRWAYVNHLRSATIDVIAVPQRRVVARVSGLADSFSPDMALSPDGKDLWAAHKKVGKVSVIDLVHKRVTAVLDTGADTNHPAFVSGRGTSFVWVTVGGENLTKVYQRLRGGVIRMVAAIPSTGVEPHGIWPSPDNSTVYVVNEKSDSVDIFDTKTFRVTDTLRTGQEGQAVVYVAGAVTSGTGTTHLRRQGLGLRVENAHAYVELSPGAAHVTVRQVSGTDMVQIQANDLTPRTKYTAYGRRNGALVPLLSFSSDAKGGVAQALAFVHFFGVYDAQDVTVRPSSTGTTGPSIELTSAVPGDTVAAGSGVPGAGSPNGSGFALNIKATTHDDTAVAVKEALNIRHTDQLGGTNADFPGLDVTIDAALTKPDGGTIPAGTNLAPLFNIAGTDDSPGAGVTIWAGWHVLESLAPGTKTITVTATVTDLAGRRARTSSRYAVSATADSGQALTPSPADTTPVAQGGIGPELDLTAPEHPTSITLGTLPQPTLADGTLFFIQVDALDAARHGIAVNENAGGAGVIVDPTQIKVAGPNRNAPGLNFTFDVALKQPNGNVVPAGQNLAPLFNIAGSAIAPGGAIRTTFDWVVGGALILPAGQTSVTMTAQVTDRAGATSTTTRRVDISPVTSGQQLTPQP